VNKGVLKLAGKPSELHTTLVLFISPRSIVSDIIIDFHDNGWLTADFAQKF
jgi:hypothetical protein